MSNPGMLKLKKATIGTLLGLVAALAGMLSGCGGPEVVLPTPIPAEITVDFPGNQALFRELVESFNQQYPHITVHRENPGPGPGNADVNLVQSFAVDNLVENGGIMPLDVFAQESSAVDLDDFYPEALALFTREGKVWAVPAGLDTMVMYYNKDLFDLYNVPYPEIGWTWDDFLETCLLLRDPNAGIFGYAADGSWLEAALFIFQNGGALFDNAGNEPHLTLNAPANVEALEWYSSLIHDYNVAPTSLDRLGEWGSSALSVGIVSNKAGMWMDGFFGRGSVLGDVELPMEWGVVPLPRGKVPFTFGVGFGYVISADTAYPDASWQWITFINEHGPQQFIPASRSVLESEAYEREEGFETAAVARAIMQEMQLVDQQTFPGGFFNGPVNVFSQAVEDIFEDGRPVLDALDWAQAQAEAMMP